MKNAEEVFDEAGVPLFWVGFIAISLTSIIAEYMGIHSDYALLALSLLLWARGLYALYTRKLLGIDLVMAIVGNVTYVLHAVTEGLLVYLLYGLAEIAEELAERYAARKIMSLRELLPNKVRILHGDNVEEKGLSEIRVGDLVLVPPGSIVPADGVIVKGRSLFDTSRITGEPIPVELSTGDSIVSGYLNTGSEPVVVRVLREPGESLLSVLVREAEEALKRKPRIQRLIERISQPYILVVLGLYALSSLLLGPYRSLAIIIAGCPSAYLIASSFSTIYSISIAATRGMIIRGGGVLEKARSINTVVLDKTGTITIGRPVITRIDVLNGFDPEKVKELAAAAAKASSHPLSEAIAALAPAAPTSAKEYPGLGVEATINGTRVLLGSPKLLENHGVAIAKRCPEETGEVLVAVNGVQAAAICLDDVVDEEALNAIRELREEGLRLVLASGDRSERVRRIADRLGVTEYHGGLSPHDKKLLVERLRKETGPVLFAGDGINDVEALAAADIGVAIGEIKAVGEVADVVSRHGVRDIPFLLRLAKNHYKSLIAAFTLATIVKLSAISLGLASKTPLWLVAAIGDDGSTLLALSTTLLTIAATRAKKR